MSEKLVIPTTDPDVVLRSITEQDDVVRFLRLRPYTHSARPNEKDAPDYQRFRQFQQIRARAIRRSPGTLHTAISYRGEFGGIADLYPHQEEPKTAEVGCEIDTNYRRMGVASLTLTALTCYARETLGFEVITAEVMNNNPAASLLLKSLGFEPTKVGLRSSSYTQLTR